MAHFSNTKKLLGIGAVGAGAGVAGIGAYHVIHTARRQREWREKAKDRDRLKLAHDIYIDKYGAMYPAAHPGMKRAKITELNAKLDYLIEFGEYPMSVVKSVWRKLAAKPKSRYWSSYPQKIIKDQKKKFQPKSSLPTELSSKLDDLIQFAVDPRPRNDLGMFTKQYGPISTVVIWLVIAVVGGDL